MATALRNREDIETPYLWNLSSIYAEDAAWESDFDVVEGQLPVLTALQGSLNTSGVALLAGLQLRDVTSALVDKLLVYALFRRDEDAANGANQARFDQIVALEAHFRAATAFFSPEILAIDDEPFEAFFQQSPALEQYRFSLSDLRRRRPHIRSAEVEDVLAQASELAQAPEMIFGALKDADLTFGTIRDTDGSEIELSHGRIWLLLKRADREIRRTALTQYNAVYAAHRTTFAATLSSGIRANIFNARVRGYTSARESALDADAIPLAVYDTLIETVHRYLPLLNRYTGLRKHILGLDTLHFYCSSKGMSSTLFSGAYEDQEHNWVRVRDFSMCSSIETAS